jgi:hypothetical protein
VLNGVDVGRQVKIILCCILYYAIGLRWLHTDAQLLGVVLEFFFRGEFQVVLFHLLVVNFMVEYAFCIRVDIGEEGRTISLERSPSLIQRPMQWMILPLAHYTIKTAYIIKANYIVREIVCTLYPFPLPYYTIPHINPSVHRLIRITQQPYLVVVIVVTEPCQQTSDKKEVLVHLITKTYAPQSITVSTQQGWNTRNTVIILLR